MATVPVHALTRSQAARRERVVRTAMELAAEGGYEAVQMRDVAARAHVALGTIYRYFSSKDHLLAEGLVSWSGDLQEKLERNPPTKETTAGRLEEVLRTATGNLEKAASLGVAMVTAITGSDPSVTECQQAVSEVMVSILSMALMTVEPELRQDIIDVMLHVWYSSLLGWVNGWRNVSSVGDELVKAAHLLCRGVD